MRTPRCILFFLTYINLSSTVVYGADNGPITNINLSSGGLAEVVRKARINSSGQIRMTVPLEQVNDVLKSMIVLDKTGVIEGLTLAGPDPLPEVFRNLPFSQDDLQSPAQLLSQLQGSRVRMEKAGKTISGNILGVRVTNRGQKGQVPTVSVLSDGRLVSMDLSIDTEITFLDEDLKNSISQALAAIGRGKLDGARTLTLSVGGKGLRDVLVSYVVPAPIWKTAYRLIITDKDKAQLQAWAVVENASGEDWKDIRLTLSSGAPVTLKQRLHDLYWRERTEIPVDVSASYVPRIDHGTDVELMVVADEEPQPKYSAYSRESISVPSKRRMAEARVGEAEEGRVTSSFALPEPINLHRGETLSIPIVDQLISAQTASIYQPESKSMHPVAAIIVVNNTPTSLPKGILTVYDQREGYIGDAQISGMPQGERRIASFAVDKKVVITKQDSRQGTVASIKASRGILIGTIKKTSSTTYTIQGAHDADRTILIEHPKLPGWTFDSVHHMESTSSHHRLQIHVPAGTKANVIASSEKIVKEEYQLSSISEQQLVYWATQAPSKEVADKLKILANLKNEYAGLIEKIDSIQQQRTQEIANQNRFRANLAAVQSGTELYQRSVDQLSTSETQISTYDEQLNKLNTRKEEVRSIIHTKIMTL